MNTKVGASQGGEEGAGSNRTDTRANHIAALRERSPVIVSIMPLLEMLTESIVAFGLDGSCIYANPSSQRLLGMSGERIVGTASPPTWIHPQHTGLWEFLFDWCRSPRPFGSEVLSIDLELVTGIADKLRARITWDPVLGQDGSAVCLLGLVRALFDEGSDESEVHTIAESQASIRVLLEDLQRLLSRMSATPARPHPVDDADDHTGNGNGPDPQGAADMASDEIIVCDLRDEWRDRLGDLSDRETEVLAHLLEGKRIATTAHLMYLSEHTIRNHLKAIYRKLGIHSLAELRELLTPTGRVALIGLSSVTEARQTARLSAL